MTSVSCPNCGTTLTSGLGAEPPSTCPDCCAKLALDAALAGRPEADGIDRPAEFDAILATGRDAPGAARGAFAAFCQGIDRDVAATGALLLSEVVTNAVLHGPAERTSTIALHFENAGGMLQVEVSDDGSGFTPGGPPPADGESGWGLQLVESLADSWGVDAGRPTRVWFELPLEAAPRG